METDLFSLSISVGRYDYLIELAALGAIEGQPAMMAPDPDDTAAMAADIAGAIRYAVFGLYELQAITCRFQLVGPEHCGPIAPPPWLGEAPGTAPSIEALNARLRWLEDTQHPYVGAGCDAGDQAIALRDGTSSNTHDPDTWHPHYCSVE